MKSPPRALALSLICMVGLIVLPAAISHHALRPGVGPLKAWDATSAMSLAASVGQSVQIVSDSTPTSDTFVNPDGTYTTNATAFPTQAQLPDGSWAPVNTTLYQAASGSIVPTNTVVGLALSGGGSGSLIRLSQGGSELDLYPAWDGLPSPTLAADTASYAEVQPGVDLQVQATADGVSEVLVVKSAQAAANPALARIAFELSSPTLAVQADAAGNLSAYDSSGNPVFDAPAPQMWDSANGGGPSGPGDGSLRASVGVEVSDSSLTLAPDQGLLTGASTTYPVYIDPAWFVHGAQAWSDVGMDNLGGSWGDWRPPVARMGVWCSPDYYGNCVDNLRGEYRSYFQMGVPQRVWGASNVSATLYTNETWSWACSVRTEAQLWWSGAIAPGQTWSSRPADIQYQSSQMVAYGNTCPAHGVAFDASTVAREAAAGHWGAMTLELRANANDEANANVYSWKKFVVDGSTTPLLQINYTQPPLAPYALNTISGTASKGCDASPNQPSVNTAASPLTFEARVGGLTTSSFEMQFLWVDAIPGSSVQRFTTSYQSSGSLFTHVFPKGSFVDGHRYWWNARGYDGVYGPISISCYFTVDNSPPNKVPVVSSTDYPYQQFNGSGKGVGVPGTFNFADGGVNNGAGGTDDVVSYEYWLNGGLHHWVSANTGLAGRPASVVVTPVADGPNTLFVLSHDRAGNQSTPPAQYVFKVTPPLGPVAYWNFDDGLANPAATTAHDASCNGNTATLSPGATWTAGRFSGGVGLNGTGAHVSAPPITYTIPNDPHRIGFSVAGSFTVTAWVYLTSTSQSVVVEDQFGSVQNGITLMYYGGSVNRWAFGAVAYDAMYPPLGTKVVSTAPPQLNTWTHLAGVYNAATGEIQIYVNGTQQTQSGGPVYIKHAWQPTGPLEIGESKYNNVVGGWWPGVIDEVRFYANAHVNVLSTMAPPNGGFC